MLNKSLKYPMAVNLSGQLISVGSAIKSEEYFCLECRTRMIARQGQIKRHHFAHYQDQDWECNPESYIHKAGKQIIADKINQGLLNNTPVIFSWMCDSCQTKQELDVVLPVVNLHIEKTLKNNDGSIARPDIVLSNLAGFPLIAVEIINTHAPEPETIETLNGLGVAIFGVKVSPEDDLLELWKHNIPGQWFIPFSECNGCQYDRSQHESDIYDKITEWESARNNVNQVLEIFIEGQDLPEIFCYSSEQDSGLYYVHTVGIMDVLNLGGTDWFITHEPAEAIPGIDINDTYFHNIASVQVHRSRREFLLYLVQDFSKQGKKPLLTQRPSIRILARYINKQLMGFE